MKTIGKIAQSRSVDPMIYPQERIDKQNVEDLVVNQKIALRISNRP